MESVSVAVSRAKISRSLLRSMSEKMSPYSSRKSAMGTFSLCVFSPVFLLNVIMPEGFLLMFFELYMSAEVIGRDEIDIW